MAGEERDARLILQAEDRASRTFAAVAKSIKDVRKELDEQVAAAARGEGSIDGINASLNELKRLGQDLVRGQGLLKSFETLSARVDSTGVRLQAAKDRLEAYRQELGATGATTDTQAGKLARLETAVSKAQGTYDRAGRAFGQVSERMERAGLVAGQFDAQTDAIAASAREAAQGIGVASRAIDGYADNLAKAQAEAKQLSDAQALQKAVQESPLGPDDIAMVLSFDNAMEKLRETEALRARELRASTALEQQNKAQRSAAIQEVLGGNQRLLASFDALQNEITQTEATTAFRRIGSDAAAAAQDVARFGVSADTTQDNLNRLSNSVRALIQPVQQAASTLEGAAELVDQSLATAGQRGAGKINEVSAAIGRLAEAERGLLAQAGLIDNFRQQEIVSNRVTAAFKAQQAEVTRLAQRVATADEPVEEWARDLAVAEGNLERLGTEMQRENTKLTQLARALDRAGIEVNDLNRAEQRLIETTRRAAAAQDQLRAKQGGKGGFLGLNPYELQNLGYQINDVFTQLGSGTPITQVFAQQGGQILQLFRGAIPMILRFLPLIGVVVTAMIALGSAVSRAHQQVQSLRDFTSIFGLMADGARYSARSFAEAETRLKDLGATAENARQVLMTFVREGLNPDNLTPFIQTATDLARITGRELPDAAKLMAEAYTGGMDQIRALNDATGLFTETELQAIQTMIEDGRVQEARILVMQRTEEQTQRNIQQLDGPWRRAAAGAAEGWRSFLDWLGNTTAFRVAGQAVDWLSAQMNNAAVGFNYLMGRLQGLTHEQAVSRAVTTGRGQRPGGRSDGPPGAASPTAGGQALLRRQQRELSTARLLTREQRIQVAVSEARVEAANAGANAAEVELAATNARRIVTARITREEATSARSAASRARGEASRAAAAERRAESLRDRIRDMTQGVENQIASMDAKVARSQSRSLDQRLSAVDTEYQRIFAAIDRAEQEGIGHDIADAFRDRVRQNIVLLRQQEEQTFHEQQLRDLTADRNRQLEAVENAYARGEITAAAAVTRANEIQQRLAPAIAAAAQQALNFARNIAGANPSPEMLAFISQMETFLADNRGNAASIVTREFTESRLRDEAARLNNVIEQRNQLVEAENALVELGLRTRQQAQTNIEAGYARTQPLLDAQLASMEALLATLDRTNPAIAILYDTWQARLEGIRAQSQYVSATFTELKSGIDNAISQNAMTGFDTIAKALGALVTGGRSVIGTFADIGLAALDFVASTIGAIGRLILQMLILDAIQKATGIPVAALAGAMNGSGNMSAGGMAGFFGSLLGGLFHGGGIAGSHTYGRRVPALAFANAPRYHGGGIAGFRPNEVPAVLKRNEEILTDDDPRHRDNMGSGSPSPRPLKQVLIMDPREVAGAMQSAEGEEVLTTFVRRNRTTLKQILG